MVARMQDSNRLAEQDDPMEGMYMATYMYMYIMWG